jgi:hypothetical protein
MGLVFGALEGDAKQRLPQLLWALWPRRMPLHSANLLTQSIRSTRAEQLLANHQLRSVRNLKFSCRELPLSNSDGAVRRGGFLAQLWPVIAFMTP